MTTAIVSNGEQTMGKSPRLDLEELVERVLESLIMRETGIRHVVQGVHEARRMRQAGDLDGALRALAALDASVAPRGELRWAYAEWLRVARQRFRGCNAVLYSQGTGRAAVLLRRSDGTLEVAATLGMRWQWGMSLSRRSLRGLKPLEGHASC